jgi:hypothetical protein
MKKIPSVSLAAAAALLAALAACFNPLEVKEPAANGLVDLTIITRGSPLQRAMSSELSNAAVNYYEVIFQAPSGEFYRTTGYRGNALRISIPPGNYAGRAVQFAGTASDKTLLAVGLLPEGAEYIDHTHSNIMFDLKALKADVNTEGTISGETVPPAGSFAYQKGNTVEFYQRRVPYYRIYAGKTYRMSYRLNTDNSLPEDLLKNIIFNNYAGAFADGIVSWGLFSDDPNERPIALTNTSIVNKDGGDFTDREIAIQFTTPPAPPESGWSTLSFSCPVSAMSTNVPHGDIWYIRGGLSNTQLDAGGNSTGGGIVFGIGDPLCNIVVNPGW